MSQAKVNKIIHLASDHAGFAHKEAIVSWLKNLGYNVLDQGAKVYDAEDDFPDFIKLAAEAVSKTPEDSCAIILGGSGQGEAMLANRYPNVRATVYYGGSWEILTLSREHNDANVLSLGARFVTVEECQEAILLWLKTEPGLAEKYRRRNLKIENITRTVRQL